MVYQHKTMNHANTVFLNRKVEIIFCVYCTNFRQQPS